MEYDNLSVNMFTAYQPCGVCTPRPTSILIIDAIVFLLNASAIMGGPSPTYSSNYRMVLTGEKNRTLV